MRRNNHSIGIGMNFTPTRLKKEKSLTFHKWGQTNQGPIDQLTYDRHKKVYSILNAFMVYQWWLIPGNGQGDGKIRRFEKHTKCPCFDEGVCSKQKELDKKWTTTCFRYNSTVSGLNGSKYCKFKSL